MTEPHLLASSGVFSGSVWIEQAFSDGLRNALLVLAIRIVSLLCTVPVEEGDRGEREGREGGRVRVIRREPSWLAPYLLQQVSEQNLRLGGRNFSLRSTWPQNSQRYIPSGRSSGC